MIWYTVQYKIFISSVQLLSCVRLFVTSWTIACQASLSITNSQSLLKLMSMRNAPNIAFFFFFEDTADRSGSKPEASYWY